MTVPAPRPQTSRLLARRKETLLFRSRPGCGTVAVTARTGHGGVLSESGRKAYNSRYKDEHTVNVSIPRT